MHDEPLLKLSHQNSILDRAYIDYDGPLNLPELVYTPQSQEFPALNSDVAAFESSMASKTLNDSHDSLGSFQKRQDEPDDFLLVRKRRRPHDTESNASYFSHPLLFSMAVICCILGIVSSTGNVAS